jgi:hypothetical protein
MEGEARRTKRDESSSSDDDEDGMFMNPDMFVNRKCVNLRSKLNLKIKSHL